MSKICIKRYAQAIAISISILLPFEGQTANANTQPEQISTPKVECSLETFKAFFHPVFVTDVFSRYNVPREEWDAIIHELAEEDKNVFALVEEKAATMDPNPLKDPTQREAAIRLFRDTQIEIFSRVLKAHNITDDQQILSMLDEIQKQKAKAFAECMRSGQIKFPPQENKGVSR
jgi:hypothetical protein